MEHVKFNFTKKEKVPNGKKLEGNLYSLRLTWLDAEVDVDLAAVQLSKGRLTSLDNVLSFFNDNCLDTFTLRPHMRIPARAFVLPNKSMVHRGDFDGKVGVETITMDLSLVPPEVDEIVFVATIAEGKVYGLKGVESLQGSIIDSSDIVVISSKLKEFSHNVKTMAFMSLQYHGDGWYVTNNKFGSDAQLDAFINTLYL